MRPRHALLLLLFAAAAPAQEGEAGQPYWVSTPPAAGAAIREAVGGVAAQDWHGAARALQAVFDRYPSAFAKSGSVYRGARAWAVRILAAAPRELRDEYDHLFGPVAEEMLRQSLSTGDRAGLMDVVRKFEATPAGLRAAVALADDAILRGRPAEARLLLAGLRRLHPAAAGEEPILRRLALAATRDHQEGGPVPRPEEAPRRAAPTTDDSWPILGGNASRNRIATPPSFEPLRYWIPVDVPERLWDQPPQPDAGYYPFRGARRDYNQWPDHWEAYNPIQPVISRGTLVVSDGRRVMAFNLYSGGPPIWQYPETIEVRADGRTDLNGIFTPVVADGVVYVALEVPVTFSEQRLQDVPIIYYLPQRRLCALDLETGQVLWRHDDAFLESHEGSGRLRDLSVTAAPVVRGDRIYAGACASEGTFHSYVVAVDRQTGDLVYATRVSNGQQELNLFGRQLQECTPMPLVEMDGVLYYGTNLGIFAAIDALLGTPLWAAPYETLKIPSTYYWFEAPRRWPQFANGPPLVSGDTVVAMPPDSPTLVAFDRHTGESRFQLPAQVFPGEQALELRTLHAVDGERAYVGGDHGVAAVWLVRDPARGAEPGEIAWATWFARDDAGAGRGLLAQDALWVPTWMAIYRIDPVTGKVASLFERGGGDADRNVGLVWGDGVLVTAGRELVGARFDDEAVLRRARDRARAHPDDAGPVLEAADISLAMGQVGQAVELYRRAKTLAEGKGAAAEAGRAQQGLHRALLLRARASLAESAYERAEGEFDTAVRAAPDDRALLRSRRELELALAGISAEPARKWRARNLRDIEREHGDQTDETTGRAARGWALLRLADLLVDQEDPKRALAVLQQLVERDPEGEDGRLASRRIGQLVTLFGRGIYETYERRARALFDAALAGNDLEALARGLRIYANAEATLPATLELARRQLRTHDAAAAARTLQAFLAEQPGSPQVAEALLLLFQALHEHGAHGPAYAVLLRLRTRYGDAPLARPDGSGAPASAIADDWLAKEPYASLARSAERRDLSPELRLRFEKVFVDDSAADVPELQGQLPEALRGTVVLRTGTRLRVLDGESGVERYSLDFGGDQPKGPLVFVEDRLYATTQYRVHVFDAATGRALMSRPVPDGGRATYLVEHRGQIFLLFRERSVQGQAGVAALNPADASVLWSQRLPAGIMDPAGAMYEAVAHENRLLVFSTHPIEVWALDPTSGAIENRVTLERSPGAALPLRLLLPGGRVLLGVVTRDAAPRGFQYWHSYTLFLVDPAAPPDTAILWQYRPRGTEENRVLQHVNVAGEYVAVVEESRGASVLELQTGREVKRVDALEVPGSSEDRQYVDASQPRHDALLLVITRSVSDAPARLSAYQLPDLRPRYSVELTESARDTPRLVDAQGVVAVAIGPRRGRVGQPRVRLLDPISGRHLDELLIPGTDANWIGARVQNGILLVTSNRGAVYAYGPR